MVKSGVRTMRIHEKYQQLKQMFLFFKLMKKKMYILLLLYQRRNGERGEKSTF